jgi:hypothetical protein
LNKEVFSLRLGNAKLSWSHGTAWEGDERQGNGACRGNAAGLFNYDACVLTGKDHDVYSALNVWRSIDLGTTVPDGTA